MPAELTQQQHYQTMLRARDLGLAQMNHEGHWELTRDGHNFLDMTDALRALDNRPGAVQPSSPRRQAPATRRSGTATPPTGSRPGDDRRSARAAQEKSTP